MYENINEYLKWFIWIKLSFSVNFFKFCFFIIKFYRKEPDLLKAQTLFYIASQSSYICMNFFYKKKYVNL